ncbi:MAG: hypothetical protein J6L65_10230 [Lachnospiraceae bacterium]|nr:hypothetical protein [Lachnospiraceae bacterium]
MSFTNSQKRRQYADYAFFALLLIVYTGITYWLFSKQVYGSEMLYHSDMKAYILEMQGLDSGYSFPYQLFFKFAAFLHLFIKAPEMAVAVAVTILNTLSLIAMKYYLNRLLVTGEAEEEKNWRGWIPLLVTVLVFALFFVSMLYGVGFEIPGIWRRYRGVFSPNPYHNATYLATRPFTIVTFFIFVRVLKDYEEQFKLRDVLLFGVFLFLSTITKPSFTFILVPAAGLILLYRLLRKRFENFRNTLFLGLSFIPTFCALLYQFFGVFGPVEGEEKGIGFGLGKAWSYHCDNIPVAILLGLAFPLAVLFLNFRDLKKNGVFRLAWQITAVSLFEILFLFEKGFRVGHLNFSWGYMHGMFFAFVASAYLLFQKTFIIKGAETDAGEPSTKKGLRILLLVGQWAVFGLHLLLGLLYFKTMLAGELYY